MTWWQPATSDIRTRADRRRLSLAVALVTGMTTAYFLLPLDRLGPDRAGLGWSVLVLGLAAIATMLLRQITNVLIGRPHTRPGLVIPLLMCLSVFVFSAAYYVLAKRPGEFTGLGTRVDALYFTLVTLTTIGYGDVVPTGQTARLVTVLQILYSFIFLTAGATALSRYLRGLLSVRSHHGKKPPEPR